ncbi:Nif11-like leader peptide family natural product precursor [Leptothoe sp. EHU-05/26/07-4]
MSIQTALQFIQHVRSNETVQHQLESTDLQVGLASLVDIGAMYGFEFTMEELQQAHRHDWMMRWVHFQSY